MYKPGTWKALCAVCGFEYTADQLLKRWDGVYVCKPDWEPRHILDFFEPPKPERQIPWSQPENQDSVVPTLTLALGEIHVLEDTDDPYMWIITPDEVGVGPAVQFPVITVQTPVFYFELIDGDRSLSFIASGGAVITAISGVLHTSLSTESPFGVFVPNLSSNSWTRIR